MYAPHVSYMIDSILSFQSCLLQIFRFDAPLYFANVDLFKTQIFEVTGVDPMVLKERIRKHRRKLRRAEKEKTPSKAATNGQNGVSHDPTATPEPEAKVTGFVAFGRHPGVR